jgi:hypothetical protein
MSHLSQARQVECHELALASPRPVDFIARESGVFGNNLWGYGLTLEKQVILKKFVPVRARTGVYSLPAKMNGIFAPAGR